MSVHNPFDLAHWSMPILELVIIAGAVFALVHAVRRYRGGDPINLALWLAPLVYLFVTEPPLYFPEWFGLDEQYGFIFAHNIFTVQFMWDRLPLYIIAIYPAMTQLAYELVRVLGIFRNRGALVASVAVAFVCHVFYEIFDHLGPQLKWWAWNDDNVQVNHPALASVPMNSMVLFASVSFGAMTYLVVRLVRPGSARLVLDLAHPGGRRADPADDGGRRNPGGLLRRRDPRPHRAGVGARDRARAALAGRRVGAHHASPPPRYRRGRADDAVRSDLPGRVPGRDGGALGGALPAFLDATDGVTSDGTPIGSGLYTIARFVGAAAVLACSTPADGVFEPPWQRGEARGSSRLAGEPAAHRG